MSYDVIVCGGGTAGSVAAVAATRLGAKTLIVDQFGFLGGTQTGALVMPLMSYWAGNIKLVTGLHQEILDRCCALPGENEGDFFNPELLKYVLEDMALEAGCDLLYHTFVHGVTVEDNTLKAIAIANKSGTSNLYAKQFIDCTGDADVAVMAGVPWESGREEDGVNQAVSLRFLAGGVDLEALAEFLRENGLYIDRPSRLSHGFALGNNHKEHDFLGDLMQQAIDDGVMGPDEGTYIQFFAIPGRMGELAFNCPRVMRTNGAKAEELTKAQIEGKKRIPRILNFCKKYLRGFDTAFISQTAPMVGVRESRRIRGEYYMTIEDFHEARKFDDGIAKSSYCVDIHNPTGGGTFCEWITPGDWQEVPYRALVPLNVDNLLVAGRCLSSSFVAQSALRIEPTCRAMGEAVGVAAAICCKDNSTPRTLNVEALMNTLRAQGANVHE